MEYTITPERQAYIDARGNTILMACPGSGKTTSIVFKLKQLITEIDSLTNGYGGVACLSFTNAACDEYRSKYLELHNCTIVHPHLISTIDSFVTQYIVLPFAHVLGINGTLRIENDLDVLSTLYLTTYVKNGERKEGLHPALRKYSRIIHLKAPEKCRMDIDGYYWGANKVTAKNECTYVDACFRIRLSKGVITSNDALFIAYKILEKDPKIAVALKERFPYIIIDEAQDTSALQMTILEKLRNAGLSNMEFIGDLSQSIYGWNNAKPELLDNLSKNPDFNSLYFTECRRSVQRIIDFYSLLRESNAPRIISTGVTDKNCPIIVYRYDENGENEVIRLFNSKCDEYNLSTRLVLVRGTADLQKLSGRHRKMELWKSPIPYNLIDAQMKYNDGNYHQCIKILRKVWSDCLYSKYPSPSKRLFEESLDDIEKNSMLIEIIKELPSLESSISNWEYKCCQMLQSKFGLEKSPSFDRKSRMKGYKMNNLLQERVSSHFGLVNENLGFRHQVHTIHAVKGATADAVLLFLSRTNNINTISLSDFPDNGTSLQKMKESQRLIYVACSRAKQFLALAFPSRISEDLIRQKFGQNVIIRSPNLQLALF